MPKNTISYCIVLLILFVNLSFGQIKIKELPPISTDDLSNVYLGKTPTRDVVILQNNWQAISDENSKKSIGVSVPSNFSGKDKIIYKTELQFSQEEIDSNEFEITFNGINYSAEIVLNEVILFKHSGGLVPFTVQLPSDILKADELNVLSVKVNAELDSENTIPLYQRYLFPKNNYGIVREVYLKSLPKTNISNVSFSTKFSKSFASVEVETNAQIIKQIPVNSDSIASIDNLSANVAFYKNSQLIAESNKTNVNFSKSSSKALFINKITITSPKLWNPTEPVSYNVKVSIFNNDLLVDQVVKPISFFDLRKSENGLLLNGKKFRLNGVNYFEPNLFENDGIIFSSIKKDLQKLKELGFNAIKFSKKSPNPYTLHLCNKLGLFAFIDLPLNSVPDEFIEQESFKIRAFGRLTSIVKYFGSVNSVVGFGLGSGYVSSSPIQISFINEAANSINEITNKLLFASFIGLPNNNIESLDFYGIEIFGENPQNVYNKWSDNITKLGIKNVFISDAIYPTYLGATNGYSNKFSFEGQAKFLERIISFASKQNSAGFFLGSAFDYKGDFASLYTGYNSQNLYNIGFISENRKISSLSSKVIEHNLTGSNKVTIPIGSNSSKSPMAFILIGVFLSIFMALLINSKRKFREDASRALLRPYNFFADIRDHRILSGFHSTLLMICLSGSLALLLTIVLFYLKNNLLLDKIILSFGAPKISSLVAYLAWNPITAFLYLYLFSIALIILHTAIVKTLSFFVKTKILTSSIFFTIVWAFLPLALLLPLELILHRVLLTEIANLYVYGFITIYLLWLLQRMMKGIYVIFDVPATTVYFYGFLIFIFIFGGILLYFQLSNSTIYLIINSIKQYNLL